MATKQDLDAKEQVVLAALQALSAKLDANPQGGFDTAPEIATLQQMADLIAAMMAKLGSTGLPGVPIITAPIMTASAQINVPFTLQVSASGGPATFAASGLPANLTINPTTGLISGIPASLGVSTVTLTATNTLGTGNSTLTLTVQSEAVTPTGVPVITSVLSAVAQAGSLFTFPVSASNSPTSFQAAGLPSGLNINSVTGMIFGTPLAGGTSSVTVSASNASGNGSSVMVLTVNP